MSEAERLAAQIRAHVGAHWLAAQAAPMLEKQSAEIERLRGEWLSSEAKCSEYRTKITKLRTALDVALEALEKCYDVTDWPANGKSRQDTAIAMLKEALK